MKLVPLPSRCGRCDQDHEEIVLSPGCHPTAHVMAVAIAKREVVEIRCGACQQLVHVVKAGGLLLPGKENA